MEYRARCPHCAWRVKASGEAFLSLAIKTHNESTGHNFKFKPSFYLTSSTI